MTSNSRSSNGSQIFKDKIDEKHPADSTNLSADIYDPSHNAKRNFLGSTQQHPFATPAQADYWSNIYKNAHYEGAHRFDPFLQWTEEEEKKLVRKIDFRIMCWVWIMFASLDLIRRNINRAVSDNLLKDLGMNTNDFNTGQTIYLVTFLAAELPVGLISKHVGPDIMTPITICAWGIVCCFQSLVRNKAGYFATRAILGIAQGGFIPEMVLYLTYWYKSDELPIRLSFYWTAIPITQIIGALLAAGILLMRGVAGLAGWRWLFIIEGLMSVIVGIITFFVMPASISQTGNILRGNAKWLHGAGWFSEREEKILVNRLLRDDPSKGDMNNRQHVNWKGFVRAISDYDLWLIYFIGVLAWIPFQPTANYMSLTLRNLGFSVFQSNMLAAPGFALFAINIVVVVWLSEKYKERMLFASLSNIWMLPFLIGLVCIPKTANPWVRYILLTGVNGIPYTHAILVGMISRNSNSVATRAVANPLYNMTYQFGSIAAVNIYREHDKPYYYRGNKILVGLCAANIVLFWLGKAYYVWRNKQKDALWEQLTKEEQIEYITTTTDTGMKRLDFRFTH